MEISTKDHFQLTFRYLQVMAIQLASALQEHGVTDESQEREIIQSFLFNVCSGWDQYYITDPTCSREKVRPSMCFLQGEEEVIVPTGEDDFHELACYGAVESVFEPTDPNNDLNFVWDNGANGDIPFSKMFEENG
ncbi:MAG: hypothetical protein K1X57_08130 [Gemmataceae bacterium]|nr:hypothetical protein [Gemmataceae bacterium]